VDLLRVASANKVAFVSRFAARRSARSSRAVVFFRRPVRGFDLKVESLLCSRRSMIDRIVERGCPSKAIISSIEYPEQ
jgi:hypothetical protein